MNNYITLDGKKYKTLASDWMPVTQKPSKERLVLDGSVDVTYAPGTISEWQGTIIAPVTPEGAGWGDKDDLEATIEKRVNVTFIDHETNPQINVHVLSGSGGGFKWKSFMRVWDNTANEWHVRVRLVKA